MKKIVVLLAVLFAACGNNTQTETVVPTSTPTPQAGGIQKCANRAIPAPPAATDTKTKPKVDIPDGPPPCTLVNQDIKVGTGATAKAGGTVTAHYVGVSWSTKQQFDSSWDRGEPTTFSLDQVVPGWREGIPGMKEGGRRRLIIPPALAYGVEGRPDSGIAGGETLVFIVDLVKAG